MISSWFRYEIEKESSQGLQDLDLSNLKDRLPSVAVRKPEMKPTLRGKVTCVIHLWTF